MELPVREFKVLYLFSGIGGAAIGFQNAVQEYKGVRGRLRTITGIDCDPAACADFEKLTGTPAHVMDLFTRQQYTDFHGYEPPQGWREIHPKELLFVCNNEYPDVVFLSPPCKGLSSLLPQKTADSAKYQALNRLVIRGIDLMLSAFTRNLPGLIILENVPRIVSQNRGKSLLKQVKRQLAQAGYVFHEGTHDCGEMGGLGQHRKRYLLIARRPAQVQNFVYQPPKMRVKSIGEVIGPLPMPGDPAGGAMHRLPRLKWKTLVRLALIPAGGDWRDLEEYTPQDLEARKAWEQHGIKTEGEKHLFKGKYAIMPWEEARRCVISGSSNGASYVADPRLKPASPKFNNTFKIVDWGDTANTVTGGGGPSAGGLNVADPRIGYIPRGAGAYGVQGWNDPGASIIGNARVNGSTPVSVADPRLSDNPNRHSNIFRVVKVDETSTGTRFGSGAPAVADPRPSDTDGKPGWSPSKGNDIMGVQGWDQAAKTVSGSLDVHSGAGAVADPRPRDWDWKSKPGLMGVIPWDKSAQTLTGKASVTSSNCPAAVADPRPSKGFSGAGKMGVIPWDEPSHPVTANAGVTRSDCPAAVADPRPQKGFSGAGTMGIIPWDEPAHALTGKAKVNQSNCPAAVADPRVRPFSNKYQLLHWNQTATTVTGITDIQSGAQSVADPRPTSDKDIYSNRMKVIPFGKTSATITGSDHVTGGALCVADTRIEALKELPYPIIIAFDNCWHRPLTTFELFALQGFPLHFSDGSPVVLSGKSDGRWRERIGNAVPPPSAQAIGEQMLRTLLTSEKGEFVLGATGIWVKPDLLGEIQERAVMERAVSVDHVITYLQ